MNHPSIGLRSPDRLTAPSRLLAGLDHLRRLLHLPTAIWLRWQGAVVGRLAWLANDVQVPDPALVEIGDGATVDTGAVLATRSPCRHLVLVGRIRIGAGAMIGSGCVIGADVEVGAQAVVPAGAMVPPGTRIPAGCMWDDCRLVSTPHLPPADWEHRSRPAYGR